MKINANSIPEFFEKSGDFKDVLIKLDELILKVAPNIDRKLYTTDSGTSIGYAAMPYKANDTFGSVWPMIGIAPQKQNASLYVMTGPIEGKYLVEQYKDKLGKVSLGKSCIRIKKWENVNINELENLLKGAISWYNEKME